MSENDQELEVKFYVNDLASIEARLQSLDAVLVQARIYENNLRFDTHNGDLARGRQVLRLRKDTAARVTYKGPGRMSGGARLRTELEFTVSDYDTALAFFLALDYEVVVMYEKYRTTYALADKIITLDELPYGLFVEIEGPTGAEIKATARQLGLSWDARIIDSYLWLFDHLKEVMQLDFTDLSFANFKSLTVHPEALGIKPAS